MGESGIFDIEDIEKLQRALEESRAEAEALREEAKDWQHYAHAADKEAEALREELENRKLVYGEGERDFLKLRAEAEALREALRRSAERLHDLGDDPQHQGRVFKDCTHYACEDARAALSASEDADPLGTDKHRVHAEAARRLAESDEGSKDESGEQMFEVPASRLRELKTDAGALREALREIAAGEWPDPYNDTDYDVARRIARAALAESDRVVHSEHSFITNYPDRCPTCGSDHPGLNRLSPTKPCPDPFHEGSKDG